jgi:capsular polysaccharide biosynthesis protein
MEVKKELDLREIMTALARKVWIIALCAVLLGAAMFVYTSAFVTPKYKSTITVYVKNTDVTTNVQGHTQSDVLASQALINTYIEMLKSDRILDIVAQELGGDITAAQIRSMITTKVDTDTLLFKLSVSNADPELAARIANVIADIGPEEAASIAKGTSAETVDYAKVATAPYTPNKVKNTLLGAVIGALLVVIVVVLQVLLDNHINGEEDLRKLSDAPVLGVIPDYELEYKKGGYEADKATRDEMMGKGV